MTHMWPTTHTQADTCFYLAHVDGERLRPAIKQLEENKPLMCWDFICIIDDEDIIRSCTHHPGHAVVCEEGTQVVIGDPAVLPTTLWEVVEKHVQDLVTYVVVRPIEEKPQETGGITQMPFSAFLYPKI